MNVGALVVYTASIVVFVVCILGLRWELDDLRVTHSQVSRRNARVLLALSAVAAGAAAVALRLM